MIEFTVPAGQPDGGPLWSRTLLQPLAPGALTPFSASLLAENTRRAWYAYFYDRLGFAPALRSPVVRDYQGRPYVNLSLSAELDAQHAGLEPVAVRVNGITRAVAPWEKPGLLAGIKLGRGAKKITDTLHALAAELDATTRKAQTWLQRVQEMRWSQAEILQIMEEIERVGSATLLPYFAVRYNLESAYGRLLRRVTAVPFPRAVALVNQALAGIDGLVEVEIARGVADLAAAALAEPPVLAYLHKGEFGEDPTRLPTGPFAAKLAVFLATYGHRCADEGEIRNARWCEDPAPLLRAVLASAGTGAALPSLADGSAAMPALLAAVDGKQRKEAQLLVQQLRQWLPWQSRALDAYAYVLAGTRRWAQAAAHEAMSDRRLLAPDDVFFYELEEMKEMMTGEWNVSDRSGIRATAAGRKTDWQGFAQLVPGELLVGNAEATLTTHGLAGAAGQGQGAAATALGTAGPRGAKIVLVAVQPDAGWAGGLPSAAGLLAAQGSPLDPTMAAAAALRIPTVYALGQDWASLADGQTILLDGDVGKVTLG